MINTFEVQNLENLTMQYNVLPDEEQVFSVLVAFIVTDHFKAKKIRPGF